MRKTIQLINERILIPTLCFLTIVIFSGLVLSPFWYRDHKKINDLDVSKSENVGWITLEPGFKERNELPKDYSTEAYDVRFAHHDGDVSIQIRKK
jgi:hypothetical protein